MIFKTRGRFSHLSFQSFALRWEMTEKCPLVLKKTSLITYYLQFAPNYQHHLLLQLPLWKSINRNEKYIYDQKKMTDSYTLILNNLGKESLNSDSHQFYQYQLRKKNLSPSTQKRSWYMTFEIQVLAWDRHKNVAGLNQLTRPSSLDKTMTS